MSLTDPEHRAVELLGEVASIFAQEIVSRGEQRDNDLAEFIYHVHNAQRMIGAQSAAREYPKLYRLLGEGPPS